MSEDGGFSIDQLMELAGLSVSQASEHRRMRLERSWNAETMSFDAVYKVHPPTQGKNVLVACGPGNNGTHLPLKTVFRCSHLFVQAAMAS